MMYRNFRSRTQKLENKIAEMQQPVSPDLFLVCQEGIVFDPDSIPIKVYSREEILELRLQGLIVQIDQVVDW